MIVTPLGTKKCDGTGLLTGCGQNLEIVRHYEGQLCGKKDQLCGKKDQLCGSQFFISNFFGGC